MMATTHAFVGLLVALPLAVAFPEFAAPIAAGALVGGVFPDLDVFVGTHRKTLHFPVWCWVPTGLGFAGLFFIGPSLWGSGATAAALAAATHASSDALGGGLERRPWEQTTDKAVYCHATRGWLRPRHYVAYDGAPSDLALCLVAALSVLGYPAASPWLLPTAYGLAVVSTGYVIIRKRLPALEAWLHRTIPALRPLLSGLHGEE